MKPVLAVVAVALGVVAFILNGKIAGLESENSALRAELAAMRAENQISANIRKKAEDEAASAAENAKRLAAERDAALARSAESPAPPTVAAVEKPPAAAADLTKGFAEMFKGEEGKQMLKMQAEMGTRLMYGDFIKKLDPSTSDAVMALLAERQGKMTSAGLEAMNAADPKAAQAKILEEKADFDKRLKAMIGEGKMAELETYERTIGDRMMFGQVESQFSSAGTPLSPEQRESVLSLMAQERVKMPRSPLEQGNTDPTEGMRALQDDKMVSEWLKSEEALHNRVLSQVNGILSPDQVNTFTKSLQQMRDMQKFGMEMGKKMFAPKK
ncbi:MAG: hypothetical protein RL088_1550 [Verrucomicrobiota bacterium]|jgi:hypothetical protein